MDAETIFRERYMQGTAYMSEELKAIENSADGVFQQKDNEQLEQEYMNAMEQGVARMRMFGIETTDFAKSEDLSARVLGNYCEQQKEVRRVHQITESRKKKKSKQETDARARLGNFVTSQMKNSAEATAESVFRLYSEKKRDQVPAGDQPLQGTEFYVTARDRQTDRQMKEQQITDLLLKRDALALRIKNAGQKTGIDGIKLDYDKQLLEKMNDALRTWMAAGGISGTGKHVSAREKAKAMKHLPLAVESYEYYVKNRDMLIGGEVLERFKKTESYADSYQYYLQRDQGSSEQTIGISQPIAGIYKDDIANLRALISKNGPYGEEKQKLISQVYQEYMQHSVAYARRNLEYRSALYGLANHPEHSNYVQAWWDDRNDYLSRQHEFAMDAATAYLKYLTAGKTPKPLMAAYIEQHWHTDAFAAGLDQTADALYADRDAYETRMRERIEQIRNREDLGQQKKNSLIDKLERSLNESQSRQAESLISASEVEIEYNRFVREQCQVTENDPNSGGYRDLVRVMMPVSGSVADVSAQESKARKVGLVKFARGVYLGDQKDENGQIIEDKRHGMPCAREEQMAEFPALKAILEHAKQDLEQYVEQHKDAFGGQSLEEAYHTAETAAGVYKKAQGMRDTCSVICRSPLFSELAEADRQQMVELWNFSGGLTEFSWARLSVITQTTGKTLREVLEGDRSPMAVLESTLEDTIAVIAGQHERELAERRNG